MVDPGDDPIELVSSQYEVWGEQFEAECDRVYDVLVANGIDGHVERIEHIGSTAVPGLTAKDIVDLDIVVADEAVADISRTLETELGGNRIENTDEWHPVFRVHNGQRFNDHVFAVSSEKWKVSVITRDVLRAHPTLRTEYEQLKHELASEHDDLVAYSKGKTAFVMRVLETAHDEDYPTFDFAVPDGP
jgi:GrpB-like predicted nucleotidyltransferase (UPF0157 family)